MRPSTLWSVHEAMNEVLMLNLILELVVVIPVAAVMLTAVVYAHRHMARLSRSEMDRRVARGLLVGVGAGFGLAMIGVATELRPDLNYLLGAAIFVAGFGLVHVPAALISLIKRVHRKAGVTSQQPEDWP